MLTILNNIVEPESGVIILFDIVNSLKQCWQQNIVQCCFHQLGTSCSFFAVYNYVQCGQRPRNGEFQKRQTAGPFINHIIFIWRLVTGNEF